MPSSSKESLQGSFKESLLNDHEREDFIFVKRRILELQEARTEHYGTHLDNLWASADRDYIPHRLKTKTRRAVATDEDKGWRGQMVTLSSADWQSDISQANPYIKIQVALATLVNQNPSGVFTATKKKFSATNELMKQLYERSWEYARSKEQLKLFVFNLAKYGWAIGRTYPLRIARLAKVLTEYNQENPEKSTYEKKEVVEYNDIYRENLDPRNAWIDDMARPGSWMSLRDWTWRKVYDFDVAREEFGKYPNWKYVQKGGVLEETLRANKGGGKQLRGDNLVEIYFYENRIKDLFLVIANGVPIVIEPLPISDSRGVKKLSCWHAYWNLRHAESPYGIGIYEAIRYDQAMLDRIRNMTIDQLTLSIYKMFFYQGTQSLTETGDIEIKPGVGRQVLDPKAITWLSVPGPGNEAWTGMQLFKADVDEASGITEPLMGVITGKTAFEIAQAKESALKRLKNPLESILEALNQEGYITLALIQLTYSIPETYRITDPALIDAYLREVQSDPELYNRDEEGNFTALVFPEFPLALEKDEKGNLIETKETQFFRVKPRFMTWEGIINVKSQSILTPSKQVDKALELEMYNMLIPLLLNPPELYQKIAKSIVKLYDKDPEDVLPDMWLNENVAAPQAPESLFIDSEKMQGAPSGQALGGPQEMPDAERLVSSTQAPERPQGLVGRIATRLTAPFRA